MAHPAGDGAGADGSGDDALITIGLTGGIATGKSTVARLLRDVHGIPVIDADAVARAIVAPGQPALAEIRARFGDGVLRPDGALDRAALGARVMRDPAERQALDAITHPRIHAEIVERLSALAASGAPVAAVEAALMVETGSYRRYDKLLVVSCHPATQLRRLMARQGFSEQEARRWIDAQMPLSEKERVADAVVYNEGDLHALQVELSRALANLQLGAGAGEIGGEGAVVGIEGGGQLKGQ